MSERPHRHALRRFITILLSFIPMIAFMSPPGTCASRAEKNQDIVFLVDVSSSMRDIFDDVKRAIHDYALQVRPGDNVVIITFGETVTLRIRQRISSDEDVALIERELSNMTPNEYYTNISGALDKGLGELQRLSEKYPDHLRTVVLMSDGKNNAPEGADKSLTFEEIFRKYDNILTVEEAGFAFFYLSLGDDPDPHVISFMEEVDGLAFDLGKDMVRLPHRLGTIGQQERHHQHRQRGADAVDQRQDECPGRERRLG